MDRMRSLGVCTFWNLLAVVVGMGAVGCRPDDAVAPHPLGPEVTHDHVVAEHPEYNVPHQILGRFYVGADHVTTYDPREAGRLPFDGTMFMIPKNGNVPGTYPLFRLTDGRNHMDSTIPTEGRSVGYVDEHVLGYPYVVQLDGTYPLRRFWHSGWHDHLIAAADEEPVGYQQDDRILGYGFRRYRSDFEHPENQISASGAEVTLVANRMIGGAVTDLVWRGRQFVNNNDFGRQIQQAIFFHTNTRTDEGDAPTEAGDEQSWGYHLGMDYTHRRHAPWAHGSPLVSDSAAVGMIATRTRPLLWQPHHYNNGDGSVPVVWSGTMSKEVRLDVPFTNVVKWTSRVSLPGTYSSADWETLAAYLVPAFERLHTFEASTGVAVERTGQAVNGCYSTAEHGTTPVSGGAIASTADGAYALGVYRRRLDGGFFLKLCQRGDPTASWDEFSGGTRNLSLFRSFQGMRGTHEVTSYLVVGSFQQVSATMQQLHQAGY